MGEWLVEVNEMCVECLNSTTGLKLSFFKIRFNSVAIKLYFFCPDC